MGGRHRDDASKKKSEVMVTGLVQHAGVNSALEQATLLLAAVCRAARWYAAAAGPFGHAPTRCGWREQYAATGAPQVTLSERGTPAGRVRQAPRAWTEPRKKSRPSYKCHVLTSERAPLAT